MQCFGSQDAFQLLHLCGVNAGVLRRRWIAVSSLHPEGFGFAPIDFQVECVHEGGGALVAHCAQLLICGRRVHNDGDRNVNCVGSWIRLSPLRMRPLRVRERVVRGS